MEILAVLAVFGIVAYLLSLSQGQSPGVGDQPATGIGGGGPFPPSTPIGSSTVWGGGGIGSVGVLDNPGEFQTTYKGVPATFSMNFTNADLGGYTIGELLNAGITPEQVTNMLNGAPITVPLIPQGYTG